MHAEGPKSGNLGQDPWIIEPVQCLLNREVEWHVTRDDFEVVIGHSWGLHRWLRACVDLPGKLLVAAPLGTHFMWNSVEHPISDVGALDDFSLM